MSYLQKRQTSTSLWQSQCRASRERGWPGSHFCWTQSSGRRTAAANQSERGRPLSLASPGDQSTRKPTQRQAHQIRHRQVQTTGKKKEYTFNDCVFDVLAYHSPQTSSQWWSWPRLSELGWLMPQAPPVWLRSSPASFHSQWTPHTPSSSTTPPTTPSPSPLHASQSEAWTLQRLFCLRGDGGPVLFR